VYGTCSAVSGRIFSFLFFPFLLFIDVIWQKRKRRGLFWCLILFLFLFF
jgi:hypothetical protein